MEVWTTGLSLPRVAARMATRAEDAGFDGMVVVDSQNLAGDCYVALAMAARETERLQLATGVTNPFTRHPAVTASAIASIHVESGGRAVLGIGRGDSALAHLGRAPARVAPPHALPRSGAGVPEWRRDRVRRPVAVRARDGGAAGRHARPRCDRDDEQAALAAPRPPQGAGRRVRHRSQGDRRGSQSGRPRHACASAPIRERLRWAIDRVRVSGPGREHRCVRERDRPPRHRGRARRSPAAACRRSPGSTSCMARPRDRCSRVAPTRCRRLHDAYDMRQHTRADSPQADNTRRAVRRPLRHHRHRRTSASSDSARSRDLGVDRFVIVGPSLGADRNAAAEAMVLFTKEVLPELHAR